MSWTNHLHCVDGAAWCRRHNSTSNMNTNPQKLNTKISTKSASSYPKCVIITRAVQDISFIKNFLGKLCYHVVAHTKGQPLWTHDDYWLVLLLKVSLNTVTMMHRAGTDAGSPPWGTHAHAPRYMCPFRLNKFILVIRNFLQQNYRNSPKYAKT